MTKAIKKTVVAISLLCAALVFACFTACDFTQLPENSTNPSQNEQTENNGSNNSDNSENNGSTEHVCSFVIEKAEEKYLKSAATCTAKAVYYYSCSCGEKGTETFEHGTALGHSFTNYVSDNNATCEKNGTETATCARGCETKDTRTDENSALGHDYSNWVSNGNGTHTKTCSHDSTHTVTENCHGGTATCTAKATCEDCNAKYGELKSHTFDQQNTDEIYRKSSATCTAKAVYYYSCSCGEKGTETFEHGKALGHSFTNYVSNNDATCEKDGTETATCARGCETKDTRTDENSALGHDYSNWVSNGNGTHTKTCSHDSTHTVTENCHGGTATCTEKATCEDCNAKYGELKPHTFDQQNTDDKYLKSVATCTAKAVYYYSCSCGEKGTTTFEYGTALGHDWQESETVIYCAVKKSQKYKCSRCTEKKEEFANAYVAGDNIPEVHKSLSVGGTCIHCGGEVLAKNGDSFVIKLGDVYQVEHYSGTAVRFSNYSSLINSAYISNKVTSIGYDAFYNYNKLTSVTIPNSVTNIGYHAFENCSSLTSVTIGNNVTSIGSSAFYNCSSLTEIKYNATECTDLSYNNYNNYVFSNAGKDGTGIKVTIGKNVKKIPAYLFHASYIKEVVFEEGSVCVSIGNSAFSGCSRLTSITIPNSVTSIGNSAFSGCSRLTSITIPNSVTSIGNSAFEYCSSLTSINVDKDNANYSSVDGILYNKTQTTIIYVPVKISGSVTIPNTVTGIGRGAFSRCSSLTSVTIGKGVTSIGESAFSDCSSLNKVNYTGTIDQWVQIDFGNWYSNPTYYAKDLHINNVLVTEANITTATKINALAFYNCKSLTSVTIGNSVTSIGDSAFYDCSSLLSVTIGNNVTSIGSSAFDYCYKLVEVINKSSLTITKGTNYGYIGYYALNIKTEGSSDIVNKDGYFFYTYNDVNYLLGYIGNETSLTLLENYNGESYVINKYAFYNCDSLTSVTIGNSVTSIGRYAFGDCTSLTEIKYNATECADLSSDNYVFTNAGKDGTGIKVTIGKNVKKIPASLFDSYNSSYSPKITEVVFEEDSVCESIGSGAFYNCRSLNKVNYTGTIDQWVQIDFGGYYSNPTYYAEGLYINNELVTEANITTATKINASAFSGCSSLTSVTIGNSVTSIGSSAFYNCSSLTSITIPDSVTSIGNSAFSGCSSLKSITIPNSVTSIGSSAFSGCSSLKSITIPNGVISIGHSAFYNCSSLTEMKYNATECADLSYNGIFSNEGQYGTGIKVTIGKNVKKIPAYLFYYSCLPKITEVVFEEGSVCENIRSCAFRYCSSLTNITIPNSVTSIGYDAFGGCSSLIYYEYDNALYLGNETNNYLWLIKAKSKDITSCIINENCRFICNSAFYGCSSLTSITIPNSVKSIGYDAFEYCSSLTSVTIGKGVTSIGSSAFWGCSSLTSITIPDSVTSIGISAFYGCSSLQYNEYDNALYLGNETNKYLWLMEAKSTYITSCIINENCRFIYNSAFYKCSSLTSVTIGSSVTSIGNSAFWGCSSLTSVYYDGTAEQWSNISNAAGNSNLTDATRYYYSESEPTESGNYWHYDENDDIAVW